MQDASAEFEAAVATHRTWVPPRLRTDWRGVGYAGDGTIDDLSRQMGETWEVDHTYDDGLPDAVTFVSGTSVPEFSTDLAGRADATTGAPITAAAYWSPLRTDSPVYGYDRDIAPVTFDVGLVTGAGREYVRVFTGQMVNTPVRGGQPKLETISAARLKLMKLILMPSFSNKSAKGIYASWPVSYALTRCGLYAGPRPRTGCAWYVPMHGSAWQMVPTGNQVFTYDELSGASFPTWYAYDWAPGAVSPTLIDEVDWIPGPYVSAPDLTLTATARRALYTFDIKFDSSAATALTQAGSAGRLEMWVKGIATDVNNAPGGSGSVSRLCSLWMATPTGKEAQLGIGPERNVELRVDDGTNVWEFVSAATLPADDAWHFVGAAYDIAAGRLWLNLDGVEESGTVTLTTANLPAATDVWDDGYPIFLTALPCAEVTFTTGAEANVDNYPLWRNDESFAATATVHPSSIKLNAIAEDESREAWQIITEYGKAELAGIRFDEMDRFHYMPLGWWVLDEQQVVTDLVTTATNAGTFDVNLDPTLIRNSIKVTYTDTRVVEDVDNPILQTLFEYPNDAPLRIGPGVTVYRFSYSTTGILPSQIFLIDNAAEAEVETNGYVTLCDVADGVGNYATTGQVVVTFDAWDAGSATLRFTNLTSVTWYLANDGEAPAMRIVGTLVSGSSAEVVDTDASSISTRRGERSLEVSASVLQTEESARRLARNLKMSLRKAVATIGADQQGIEVLANPLRQPGDLATFTDDVTGVTGGLWRVRGVHHKGEGAKYVQAVIARKTLPIMIIGEGLVGESLIGPRQD